MTGLAALLKKELKEQLRTYRLLIIGGGFLFFGLSTPLMLKYLPEILRLAGEDVVIEFPAPTALMSLQEYSSTLVQVGVLIAVLMAMGAIARERERGTAAMVLSKPVGRGAFVVAKLTAMSTSFIIALGVASVASYVYTVLLFGEANASGFLGLNLLMALFFVVSLSVTLLFSSLFRSQLAAGGVALAILIGQAVLSGVPWIGDYTPGRLVSWGTELLSGAAPSAWTAVAASLAIVALCLYLARLSLRRKEI